jgi:hypothetical protein
VGCSQVSDEGLRALADLTALTKLNLARCEQVSDEGLRGLASLTASEYVVVVVDGASFIVCLVYCLSHLVCDVYLYCGIKDF